MATSAQATVIQTQSASALLRVDTLEAEPTTATQPSPYSFQT